MLLTVLSQLPLEAENITISITEPTKPAFIKCDTIDEDIIILIMPLLLPK
jgi:DNA polymerase III sliding clamp (beta) subunit (PCNA family)